MPMFDLRDAAGVMSEINACRKTYREALHPCQCIRFDRGWETIRLSFLVNRPAEEPGFRLRRVESQGRDNATRSSPTQPTSRRRRIELKARGNERSIGGGPTACRRAGWLALLADLDSELIGLAAVKRRIRDVAALWWSIRPERRKDCRWPHPACNVLRATRAPARRPSR